MFTFAGDHYRPFQIFPEFSRDNLPFLKVNRSNPSNLYERPMPGQSQRGHAVRHWAAHNEMIISMHQNAYHSVSSLEARIENRAPNGEVIDHLLREPLGIFGQRGIPT
jgi:hypothetical protein